MIASRSSIAIVGAFAAFAFVFSQTAFAKDCCWIDTKTGKRVPTVPEAGVNIAGAASLGAGTAVLSEDRKTAHNTRTGQNYRKEEDGCWIDIQTGKQIPTVPEAGVNIAGAASLGAGTAVLSEDRNSAKNTRTGATYKRVPCPTPASTSGDCLSKKFPDVQRSHDGKTAFDPQSGRNFAWEKDKQAWIDVKTGECICPCSGNAATNVRKTRDCLDEKFPGVHHSHDGKTAFDPQSGRNFAWEKDKQAWIDVKTGECICPCSGTSTGETLKKIFQSVDIGIGIGGGGGGDHRHGGGDRHRTVDKVPTSKKTTTGTSHKTVTAGCKCHPCTCSPCTCH